MSAESYSLAEVAELLGVSKRTLQRQIRDGAFPGRFLAPSAHGMEMRIPAVEVAHAGGVRDVVSVEAAPEVDWNETDMTVVSSVPGPANVSMSGNDLEVLREGLVEVIRDERARFLAEVRAVIQEHGVAQRSELESIREAVGEVAEQLGRLRTEVAERATVQDVRDGWAAVLGGQPSELDIDSLLSEIGELEAMLGLPES